LCSTPDCLNNDLAGGGTINQVESTAQPLQSPPRDHAKLVSLAVLHMAQYFPITFTGVALPFLFRKQGLPLEMFWLLALPAFPRWLKWLIALLVDNYGNRRIGQRKSWIIPCTLISTLSYAGLALIDPALDTIYLIIGILVATSFVMAAQDIAVDAYAAESMTDAERPLGTSLINFLAAVAAVLATASLAMVDLYGWDITMLAAAALLLLAALPAMLRHEPPAPAARAQREARGEKPSLLRALKRKDSHQILPFMFMFGFGHYFFLTMLGPFWADKGMSIGDYGFMSACAAIAGGALAAATTPWLVARFGMRISAGIGLAVLPIEALVYCYFALQSELPGLWLIIVSVALLSFSTAIYLYTVNISRFRWVSKAQAGTDYSMQSSMWNLGIWAAGSVSGLVAGQFGYVVFFPVAAAVTLIGGSYYIARFSRIEALVQTREQQEATLD